MFRHMLVAALAATSSAHSVLRREASEGAALFTIELAPGVTQVVTEEEKWALRNVSRTQLRTGRVRSHSDNVPNFPL